MRIAALLTPLLVAAIVLVPANSAFAVTPTITTFSPASGSIGTAVTVTGTGLAGTTAVELGGVPAHFTVMSATQVQFTVPPAAGSGPVTVTTHGGTVTSASAFTVEPGSTLSPSKAAPAGHVTVKASGLSAFEAVDIFFDTTDLALATTSRFGAVSASVTVPATTTPGTHWITTVGRHSGAATQTAMTVRTSWKMRGGRPSHTGLNTAENLLDRTTVSRLDDAWSAQTGDIVMSSPAVADGTAYVGSEDGSVYAVDSRTGTVRWSVATGGFVDSSPAVVDGTVYVGSESHKVLALEADTGAVRWAFSAGGGFQSSPVVANGIVYIASRDNNVYALDADTGALNWTFATGDGVTSSPAVANGVVYAGSANGKVFAIDAVTGTEKWSFTTGGAIESSPAVAAGTVYIGSDDDNVYALSTSNGVEKWSFDAGEDVFAQPAVAGGIVYVGSLAGKMFALETPSGTIRWTFDVPLGSVVLSSATIANGVVYVGVDTQVVALDAASGRTLWDGNTGNFVGSSPAVVDGMVYAGSFDHRLYAWSLPDPATAARPVPAMLHPAPALELTGGAR